MNEADLQSARRSARFLRAGMDEAVLIEITRAVGVAMHGVASTLVDVVSRALLEPGLDEALLAQRYAMAVEQLLPDFGQTLETVLRRHMLDDMTQSVLTDADRLIGIPTRTRAVAVGFADLVGFTRLGERVAPDELSEVADRFTHQAGDLALPPVRLVKTIGDAVMLVSPDVGALLEVLMTLMDDHGQGLHAGMAFGQAVDHRGDFFGRPVNLASRVCGVAAPGSLLTTAEVRYAVADARYTWSKAGMRRLKNVAGTTALWRVRRAEPPVRRRFRPASS
jgi:adenylate cyclase